MAAPPTDPATLDAAIAASAELLGVALSPDWLPGVRVNLAVTLRMAALVEAHPLPDDAEPAAVFKA